MLKLAVIYTSKLFCIRFWDFNYDHWIFDHACSVNFFSI